MIDLVNELSGLKLSFNIEESIKLIKDILKNDDTVIFRKFKDKNNIDYCLIHIDGMAKENIINEYIITPILDNKEKYNFKNSDLIKLLLDKVLKVSNANEEKKVDKIIDSLMYGNSILLVDKYDSAITINTIGWDKRAIGEPLNEVSVKGSRESFTESLTTNITLIRRKISNPDLKFQIKFYGEVTKTRVCICYIDSLVNKKILNRLINRLSELKVDGILTVDYIQELVRDYPLSPFKTIGNTERPDSLAGKLLEGKIGVLCENTPYVLTLPYIFVENFQVSEDYFNNTYYSSFNRIIRILGFFMSISIPAVYVFLTTFHQELIPTNLILSIAAAREGVPLPTVLEAILMIFTFELLREAGVRMPRPIGQAVSIVGALILGDAAVNARFVSAPMIIIVAISGICELLVPKLLSAIIIIRIILLLLSSTLGFFGYIIGIIGLVIHLMSIKSFGIPYINNIIPLKHKNLQDLYLRFPWNYMRNNSYQQHIKQIWYRRGKK